MGELLNLADVEKRAKRRLPKFVYDMIMGGAEDEVTLRANREAYSKLSLVPRTLVDVSTVDMRVTVFGDTVALPLMLAPTGICRLASRNGELDVVRAAGREGIVAVVSGAASYLLEEIAAAASAPLWYGLYPFGSPQSQADQVERAAAAGFRALCITVDVPIVGKRERDLRNQFTVPPRVTLNKLRDLIVRPRWLLSYLFGVPIRMVNIREALTGVRPHVSLLPEIKDYLINSSTTWDFVAWVRRIWRGPLALKGIMTAHDAIRALDNGVDGIVVSNHGGRQLDGVPATLEVLPEIVQAVGARAEVFVDGGIRRGSDVIKAIALGARACLIGRPYYFGLGAGGEDGVVKVIEILRGEIERTLMLLGRRSIGEIDRSVVRSITPAPSAAPS